MKGYFLLFLILFHFNQCFSIPAYPRLIKVEGYDVPILLFGDENVKWAEDVEGHTIIRNNDEEWVYASLDSVGHLVASCYKIGTKTEEVKSFLSKQPLHIRRNNSLKSRKISISHKISSREIQPVVGQRRVLIILMEFQDLKFQKSTEDFDKLFNQRDYSVDGAQGSVRDYFYRSSYGQLLLSCDIYGPFRTSKKMNEYGGNDLSGNDKDPFSLFEEAIANVSQQVDLSKYDANSDGYLDNVHIIFAGYGEEAGGLSKAIWSHESTFSDYEINDIKIDRYSCSPELRGNSGTGISRIGPHCHEIGHALGAMDFYDTDYSSGGQYLGTGNWDLMASGSWNNDGITPADINPYVKTFIYKWIDPLLLPDGEVILNPSDEDKSNYYVIKNGIEMYILENRNPRLYHEGLPGKGLLFFHVHEDIDNAGNKINCSYPQKCYIVCASSNMNKTKKSPEDYGDLNSSGCPFPGSENNDSFTANSLPQAFWWNDSNCEISITDISMIKDGSIKLFNNSRYVEPEVFSNEELFFEGFEDNPQFSVIKKERTGWEIIEGGTIITKPYDGDCYLQLSGLLFRTKSTINFNCKIEKTDEIRLSGYILASGMTRIMPNKVRIGWKTVNNSHWIYHDMELTINDIWAPFQLNIIPEGDMEFIIEGEAQAGSIIALDNLSVDQKVITSLPTTYNKSTPVNEIRIYSITGSQKCKLSRGINIVKQKDGKVKKIFIK